MLLEQNISPDGEVSNSPTSVIVPETLSSISHCDMNVNVLLDTVVVSTAFLDISVPSALAAGVPVPIAIFNIFLTDKEEEMSSFPASDIITCLPLQ
jgi:hypothetical protein